jgi:hypothetical protein
MHCLTTSLVRDTYTLKLFLGGDGHLWPPMSIKCWVMGMNEPRSTGISKGISLYSVHFGLSMCSPKDMPLDIYWPGCTIIQHVPNWQSLSFSSKAFFCIFSLHILVYVKFSVYWVAPYILEHGNYQTHFCIKTKSLQISSLISTEIYPFTKHNLVNNDRLSYPDNFPAFTHF